jgi:glycerophosphoryl diester phosphodiesterase
VRLYAHRGSTGSPTDAPENTAAAVAAALDAGADGAEVDLRRTADGVLAVSHDPDLRRLAGSPLAVATTPWAVLRVAAAAAGVALARAEDVLDVLAGRPVVLELKQPPPGLLRPTVETLADLLAGLPAGRRSAVTVSSFAPPVVAAVRTALPGVRTALIGRPADRPAGLLRRALDAGHDEIHPHVTALLADPAAVHRAHALGAAVVPWTVNRGPALRRLARLGVDGVITDVPAAALATLSATRLRRTA